MDEEPGEFVVVRRRRAARPLLLGGLAVSLVALLVLWIERGPIATGYIDRELARRGVTARYRVERIGLHSERLADVVIGDPAQPDLTARSVEVELGWSLSGPKVGSIRARGVRIRGRLEDGRLRLGQLERLMPPSTGGPFRLPDQRVDLADTGMRLDTPWGVLGIGLEGSGRLSDGFRGRLAVAASRLAAGGCRAAGIHASWAVAVAELRPSLRGPVSAEHLACAGGVGAERSRVDLAARLEPGLDGWNGRAAIASGPLTAQGQGLGRLAGEVSFAGSAAETRGRLSLRGEHYEGPQGRAASLVASGPYAVSAGGRGITYVGDVAGAGIRPAPATVAPARNALAGLASTPLGPVGAVWTTALDRALRSGIDAQSRLRIAIDAKAGVLGVERLVARARSGARAELSGGDGLVLAWPGRGSLIDGSLALSGGGFPESRFRLAQARPGGPIEGRGRIAPVAAGGARLALGEIVFGPAAGGTRIETVAQIDGPFEGGRVAGLVVPIRARIDGGGGFALGEGCTVVAFRALQAGSLRLGPTRLPLCPAGRALLWSAPGGRLSGGASVTGMRLAGSLGSSPVTIAAARFRFALPDLAFTAGDVAVRLGRPQAVNRLDFASLAGRAAKAGLAGSFSGGAGKLAAVPLLLSDSSGSWRLRGSDLALSGGLTLADAMDPPRFYPLVSRDFRLTLAGNRIEAGGALGDPKTGTHVLDARISHDLASGAGRAVLDVPGLRFDPAYQPEQLTRLTVGVVALVQGTLKGQGVIAWNGQGTSSSGTFSTENMNLAANFGPVEGLTTTLHFTDLLGLVSAPDQLGTVKVIRTGVDVFDGRVRYQILPDLKVRVEEGRWPFAGGELLLEDTVLDFSRPAPKHLTFRVTGMDVARFIQQMQFSNIAATGTVDGVVPMIFDERGGRVEGGHLVARADGGTLSYVGELTDRDLGTYGKLAFDALKSLRYSKLVVDLNGSLEAEFVAGIELDGIARNVAAAPAPKGGISAMVVGRALGQLAKIPFEFNIQVRGPFRALIGTARSFNDPTNLIQSVLPEMLRGKPTTTTTPPVQPKESEPVR